MAGAIASQSHQTIFSRGIVFGVVAYQSHQTFKSGLTNSTSYEGDRQSPGSNPFLLFRDMSPVVNRTVPGVPRGRVGLGMKSYLPLRKLIISAANAFQVEVLNPK